MAEFNIAQSSHKKLRGNLTHTSWEMMKQRCLNPKRDNYKHYGGRGIAICNRWMMFKNFLEDMGERPSKEYTLERINGDGDYEPGNCIWADKTTQAVNRPTTILITHNGITDSCVGWDRRLGLTEDTIGRRIRDQGMSYQEAIEYKKPIFKVMKKDTGEYIGEWQNQRECSKDIGVDYREISGVLKGNRKSAQGYVMEYV